MNKKKRILAPENFKAEFGKYEGKLVSWVVENDRSYATWLANHSNSKTKTRRVAQSLLDTINKT